MAEAYFAVKGRTVLKIRLEPTEIIGKGNSTLPTLRLQLKLQPAAIQEQSVVNYTLLRLAGELFVAGEQSCLAIFETPPLTETSSQNPHERSLYVDVPLDIRQLKRIEELRDGKDLVLRLALTGLVALDVNSEFALLTGVTLHLQVPQSHWIEQVLKAWNISDLRLLEINFSANGQKEVALAQKRLEAAEQLYRTGDYPHVLTELRSAFIALLEGCSGKKVDKDTLETLLGRTHPKVRETLIKTFSSFREILHLGPHPPSPTPEVPIPISRHDARFALVTAHAIFEYFASENWPGI